MTRRPGRFPYSLGSPPNRTGSVRERTAAGLFLPATHLPGMFPTPLAREQGGFGPTFPDWASAMMALTVSRVCDMPREGFR